MQIWSHKYIAPLLGEDNVSFERNNKLLLVEWKKTIPNREILSDLVLSTYAHRRADITANKCNVDAVFSKYPFLQDKMQVL